MHLGSGSFSLPQQLHSSGSGDPALLTVVTGLESRAPMPTHTVLFHLLRNREIYFLLQQLDLASITISSRRVKLPSKSMKSALGKSLSFKRFSFGQQY